MNEKVQSAEIKRAGSWCKPCMEAFLERHSRGMCLKVSRAHRLPPLSGT